MRQKFNPELIVNFRDIWNVRIHFLGESIELGTVRKLRENQKFFNISDSFFNEIESFAQRNSIEVSEYNPPHVCLKCLKAHIITIGRKSRIPSLIVEFIANQIECDTGHGGYYTDQNMLVKIDLE